MERSKQEKLDLLEETVNYYNADVTRRCVTDTECRYSGETVGKPHSDGCAVGRLLTPELRLVLDSTEPADVIRHWDKLPKEVQSYGDDYLVELQSLHDFDGNWDENGITSTGEIAVDKMILQINIEEL